jgi:hypothetical protein
VYWTINGREVFRLLQPGHRLAEQYRWVEHGGYAKEVFSSRFYITFGTFTGLDFALPDNYNRALTLSDNHNGNGYINNSALVQLMGCNAYVNVYPNKKGELVHASRNAFAVSSDDKDTRIFGQGVVMCLEWLRVSYDSCPPVCVVDDTKALCCDTASTKYDYSELSECSTEYRSRCAKEDDCCTESSISTKYDAASLCPECPERKVKECFRCGLQRCNCNRDTCCDYAESVCSEETRYELGCLSSRCPSTCSSKSSKCSSVSSKSSSEPCCESVESQDSSCHKQRKHRKH